MLTWGDSRRRRRLDLRCERLPSVGLIDFSVGLTGTALDVGVDVSVVVVDGVDISVVVVDGAG